MLFWVSAFFWLSPLIGLAAGLCLGWANYQGEKRGNTEGPADFILPAAGVFILSFFGMFGSIPASVTWFSYAEDLAKVEAQHHRIQVYEERVSSLTKRLSDFEYPTKADISLDADTPWASMVTALNDAESELAEAKNERAIAIRSIHATRRGPMSGVVTLIGSPKGVE